ncbi:MAG TPA: class I SAM-dependent methyltransferase [Saprospiraceae bacterium]|nr:class I SAM-dependent methyltransferase [Saprospiraceae bacterium]
MDPYQNNFDTWDKVADLYQETFMDLDTYNDSYDAFCKAIEKPVAHIFEIGCGPGNITRYYLSKRPDDVLEAIDSSANMIRLAQANNPTAAFRVMDCRQIDQIESRYDGIICGFVLPYLSNDDRVKLIHDCAGLLTDGGVLYLSALKGDSARSGYEFGSNGKDRMYIYYHPETELVANLESNQFEVLETFQKVFSKPDGSHMTHLIILARKSQVGPASQNLP